MPPTSNREMVAALRRLALAGGQVLIRPVYERWDFEVIEMGFDEPDTPGQDAESDAVPCTMSEPLGWQVRATLHTPFGARQIVSHGATIDDAVTSASSFLP